MVKSIEEIAPEKRERIMAIRQMCQTVLTELMMWGSVEIPQKFYKKLQAYCRNRDINGVYIVGEGMRNNICSYKLGFDVEKYSDPGEC